MSENTSAPAAKPPAQTPAQVPGAAAGSTAAPLAAPVTPPAHVPPGAGDADPESRAARLEDELAKIRAEAITGLKAVLRVLPPHSSMTWAGHTVTSDPTEVPASAVPGLSEAAMNAGVKLIQES